MTRIIIIERWPDAPGRGPETNVKTAYKRAESADGKWWLVREQGWLKHWRWLPVNGLFVSLQEIK